MVDEAEASIVFPERMVMVVALEEQILTGSPGFAQNNEESHSPDVVGSGTVTGLLNEME